MMRGERAGLPARRLLFLLCATVATAYGLWILRTGIQVAADTATYSRWADLLIAHRFNIPAYLRDQSFIVPPVLYVAWIALVAGLKTLLGSSWMSGVVALNWMALAAGVYATLAAVRLSTASTAGMLLASLLFLAASDLLIFTPFVLSDLLFWGASTVVLGLGVRLAIAEGDEDRRSMIRSFVAGSVLVVIATALRPAALPLVAFWIATMIAWWGRPLVDRFANALLLGAAMLAAIAVSWHAYILVHPSAWPFGPLPAMLTLLSQEYRDGVLVYAPESSFLVEPATNWLGAVRLTVQKLVYVFTPWLPHYSAAHTMMNLAFFVPAYGLSIAAIVNLRRLAAPQQRAAWLLTLYLLCVPVFHAMMQIEYDHRYRLPMLPALIMLATIGLESVRRPRTLASIARTR